MITRTKEHGDLHSGGQKDKDRILLLELSLWRRGVSRPEYTQNLHRSDEPSQIFDMWEPKLGYAVRTAAF